MSSIPPTPHPYLSILFLPHLLLPKHASPSLTFRLWLGLRLSYLEACNRYGLSVIGLPCVIHSCNLGDGLMWRLHRCPYYDSVSACGEERLVRGGIDWSFTFPALFTLPSISLFLYQFFFLACHADLVWP